LLIPVLWLPSPDRDAWAFLLLPAALISLFSTYSHRRLYGQSRFYFVFGTFLALCMLSIYTSPYLNRGWVLLFRPIAGLWILATVSELSLPAYSKRWVLSSSIMIFLIILLMGIGGLNWEGKA